MLSNIATRKFEETECYQIWQRNW